MKKSLVTLLLACATAAVGQTGQPQSSAPGQGAAAGQTGAAPQQKKEIKDPAEYNAYMAAIGQQDPNQKATALEQFLQQYPNSVMKPDALELLMRTYQQTQNVQKTEDTANRLLQVDPNNVTALALMSYTKRLSAQSNQNGSPQQNLAQAAQYGEQGLNALKSYQKPEGMSDADFDKLRMQLGAIFNSSIGINALQNKDYQNAQTHLVVASTTTPTDFSVVYPTALAMLDAPQPDYLDGLWFIARAVALAPSPQYKASISEYGRRKYIKYHGGDDGWTDILAQAAASPNKPDNYNIKPAPTPAEQAATLVQQKTVDKMSFDEIQMVLTSGNQQAADQVWNGLKDKPIAIEGKVIDATATKLMIAGTYDDINANPPKADIELTMTAAIPSSLMPKAGQMLQFQGTPVSYDPNPFMVHMDKGALIRPKAAPKSTPTHRSTTHRKTTSQ